MTCLHRFRLAWFESSRSSQAPFQLKIVPNHVAKGQKNRGFLALCGVSPDAKKRQSPREIAESLDPICVIFPFSGDSARRPFSIRTARQMLQCFWVSSGRILRHVASHAAFFSINSQCPLLDPKLFAREISLQALRMPGHESPFQNLNGIVERDTDKGEKDDRGKCQRRLRLGRRH